MEIIFSFDNILYSSFGVKYDIILYNIKTIINIYITGLEACLDFAPKLGIKTIVMIIILKIFIIQKKIISIQ